MTDLIVNDVRPRVQFEQTVGGVVSFDLPFPALAADHVKVSVDGGPVNAEPYSVENLGQTGGARIVFAAAPALGAKIAVWREAPVERLTDFADDGTFRAKALNQELDRITLLLQELEALTGDAVRKPPSDADLDLTLPDAASRANRFLSFDADGRPEAAAAVESIGFVQENLADIRNYADTYLGARATDPTTRNDGAPLQDGDLYFNTTFNRMRIHDQAGAAWIDAFAINSDYMLRNGSLAMNGPLDGTRLVMQSTSGPVSYYGRNVLKSTTALSAFNSFVSIPDTSLLSLESDGASPSLISHHVPGVGGVLAGFDSATAWYRIGGWSFPANAFALSNSFGGRLGIATAPGYGWKVVVEGRSAFTGHQGSDNGVAISADTNATALFMSDHTQATLRAGPRSGGRFSFWTDGQNLGLGGGQPDQPALDIQPAAGRIEKPLAWHWKGGGYNQICGLNLADGVSYADLGWSASNFAQIVIPFAFYPLTNGQQLYLLTQHAGGWNGGYRWNYTRNAFAYSSGTGLPGYVDLLNAPDLAGSFWSHGCITIGLNGPSYGTHIGGQWWLSHYRNSASGQLWQHVDGAFTTGNTAALTGIRIGVTTGAMNIVMTAYGVRWD